MITPCFMGIGMLTKQAIYHQFTSFLGIAGYLFLLFGILALHESVVSAKNGIEYHFYGFAIINALVLGKVILVADDFHFAEWFKERAPIYSILAKAVAFTILLLIFDIVEEVVVGKFKGKSLAESFPHVGDGSPRAFFYMMIVFAIALIPFFSFKEIGRVFGERELRSLLFTPAKRS
jgi:phosphatidylserine synthase